MTAIIFLLAIAPVLCNFVGFLAGARGDTLLRQKLLAFYIAVQGDWTNAYRRPAGLVARYLSEALGRRAYRVPLYIIPYSLVTTSLLAMAHLNLTIPNGVDAAGPVLSGEGHFDIGQFWSMYLAPNLAGDLLSWPMSLFLFTLLARARPTTALVIGSLITLVGVFAFVLVARLEAWGWDFMSIPASAPDLGPPAVYANGGYSDEWVRASSAAHEIGLAADDFTFDYWGAVPLAVFLPAVLFGVTTLATVLIVIARPVLYRPTLLIVERLDASSKTLFNLLSAALIGLAVIVTALRTVLHQNG